MKNNKKKWVKPRHKFWFWFWRGILNLYSKLAFHARIEKTRLKKDENVLILANHQTDIDAFFVSGSFNKPIYFVATDTLFSNPLAATFVNYFFAPIPKKKGVSDMECIKNMLRVKNEGGSVCLFVEGNRNYAEFVYHIDFATVKLIRKMGLPILIYHIEGGNGISPRFKHKRRKGYMKAYVYKRLEKDEYDKMSDEELLSYIKENIKVFDSSLNREFKSNKRAEYLERMLFACPKCMAKESLVSNGNYITCNSCGLSAEFTTDLHLKLNDENIKFARLVDWYDFERKYCLNYQLTDSVIFSDKDVKLYSSEINKPRKLLFEGEIKLYQDKLVFGDYLTIDVHDIEMASPVSGIKIALTTKNKFYIIKGHPRFNPLKYVFMLNRLDTPMKQNDLYYRIDNELTD